MIALGVNAAHDAAACVLVDGRLVAAVPEERLSRVKHHEGFPHLAVAQCLREAQLPGLGAVDAVVLNEYVQTDHGLDLRHAGYDGELITNPSHHLLHAYYAWIASGFDRAAILVADGAGYNYGEYERRGSPLLGRPPRYSEAEEAESLYAAADGELELVAKRWALWDASQPYYRFPSLGHMFSLASQYIFGHWTHAGKTMGLAPYGDASRFPEPIVEFGPDGMTVDTEWIATLPERSGEPAHLDAVCRDVAAKVQEELERAVLRLARDLHASTGLERLCLCGGVALNSVTNGRVVRESPFARLHVPPAPGDSGIAVGAALYGHRVLAGEAPRWQGLHGFLGAHYGRDQVDDALAERRGLVRSHGVEDPAEAAARDVDDGLVVGWYEGASEFGPRALGHRSIVCDARRPGMRDRLNSTVKFREPFRPYAASVLAEHAREYFATDADDPFMMIVADVVESQRRRIPSVCHVDGTCRIQTVDSSYPGLYRRLIERFHARSGVPLVLNTSFNVRGEPIVETPADALRCFLGCDIDVLYLEGRRVEKASIEGVEDAGALVPHLDDGVVVGAVRESRGGASLAPRYHCETRTGYRAVIDEQDFLLMSLIDGRRTIAEIVPLAGGLTGDEVAGALGRLQRNGFIAVKTPA